MSIFEELEPLSRVTAVLLLCVCCLMTDKINFNSEMPVAYHAKKALTKIIRMTVH